MKLLPTLLFLVASARAASLTDVVNSLQDGISIDDIKQGILPDFMNWDWSVDEIQQSLGVDDNAWDDVEIKVLNVPGYANYSSTDGWMLRFHAWAYKEPLSENSPISNATLDNAANGFLPDLDIDELQPDEQNQARNLTSIVLSVPQDDVAVSFYLYLPPNSNFTSNWNAQIIWPIHTSTFGEIDGFVQLPSNAQLELPDGSNNNGIVRLDMQTNVSATGNASAYLVPPKGVTIVSDIDDILRVTKVYQPQEGLLNTFARPFRAWLNMPAIYAAWSNQHPEEPYHFHYLTTTPQPATRLYENFIYNNYPLGSFDTRPYNFTNLDATFAIREHLLRKVIETFPQRRFVLVGDTSNSDVMKDYPQMMRDYPNVQCILMRNTSATDEMRLPYNTGEFETLPRNKYMFFTTPDDLIGLDLGNGNCRNGSVPYTTNFGWHWGLGFDQGSGAGRAQVMLWGVVAGVVVGLFLL